MRSSESEGASDDELQESPAWTALPDLHGWFVSRLRRREGRVRHQEALRRVQEFARRLQSVRGHRKNLMTGPRARRPLVTPAGHALPGRLGRHYRRRPAEEIDPYADPIDRELADAGDRDDDQVDEDLDERRRRP
jgi:hypothetical protein